MTTEDIIVIAVLVVIVGLAALYVYRAKKSGKKCIGCSGGCSGCSGSCSSCGGACKLENKSEENK